ncbi:hypothetical protein [Paenisporosarcina antarctica]|uniref:Uncharacterized protein n=1 Tax=Paenisporosarcina antarctica TaxID=417367 RepID=A0A4P6ZUS6_9BACL|nr:hypothetical protein [Paenisporosarcina antarctica]QBP39718.1 hypothetical protein E2636_00435 [Paenisporosarcina antarctica]
MEFDTLKWVLLGVCVLLFMIKFYIKRESLLWGIIFYTTAFAAISYYVYFNEWRQGFKIVFLLLFSFAYWQFLFKEIAQFRRLRKSRRKFT